MNVVLTVATLFLAGTSQHYYCLGDFFFRKFVSLSAITNPPAHTISILFFSKPLTKFPGKLAESWEGEGAHDAAVPDPDHSRHLGTCRPAGVYRCFVNVVVLLFCFVVLSTRVFLG